MCGIVARVDGGDADASLVEERGPHGTATWREGELALGLARLAIVAPNEAARVHVSSSGAIAAVMNGEIYEHRALRVGLGVDDGTSDQALLPVMFERGGVDAIFRTRAPITCAIADTRDGSVTLMRDRFGKRPLFVDEGLRAASEMKALVAMRGGGSALKFARASVTRFLSRGILEDDAPIVHGIESVPPGGVRVMTTTGALLHAPPGTSPGAPRQSRSQAAREGTLSLGDALRLACARRVDGLEVPAAVLLSGGLDSSVIGALCASRVRVAYCMRIRSSDTSDESDKARAMADALGLELRVVGIAPPTFADLAACAWRLETPDAFVGFGVAHAYATLARRLRDDGIRVVVTGEGADELFMGYAWQRAQAAAQNGWPFPLDSDERAWTAASIASSKNTRALEVFLRARFGSFAHVNAEELVNEGALDGDVPQGQALGLQAGLRGAERRRAESLHVDMQMWPLRIADRILMGHGIEPRAPFLDEDVVDSSLAMPARDHESAHEDKPQLRSMAREILPAHVDVAPKQGFGAWSWPGASLTREWAARLAREGTVLARAAALDDLARTTDDASALLAWRLVVLEVTARQLDAARGGSRWIP